MRVKPKPCPNCGSKYVEMWTKFFGGNGFEVRCLDCGYIGELGKTRAAAVRAWNNDERTLPPHAPCRLQRQKCTELQYALFRTCVELVDSFSVLNKAMLR